MIKRLMPNRMILAFTACLLASLSCSQAPPAPQPLNVLFITADDLGLQLGCYGDTVIETPQLDAFAASGVQFDYRQTNHVEARQVKLVAERASEFITQSGDQPFFLIVNYTDPHAYRERNAETNEVVGGWTFLDRAEGIPETLVDPSEEPVFPFQRIDSPEQRARVAGYYNEVKRLDTGVGLLLKTLERAGHADNTLVIFIGDHGPPFNRGKTTTYEGGLRVPFLVRWPGVSKPMRSSAMVSTVDILPTILDATGATSDVEMHGRLRTALTN